MQLSKLGSRLAEWSREFSSVSGVEISAPETLWEFLANRLVDNGVAEGDPEILRANIGGALRKVRITGLRGQMVCYELADGSIGSGMILREDIPRSELPKFTAAIERLVADGKV